MKLHNYPFILGIFLSFALDHTFGEECTKESGLLKRLGETRFFIIQNLKTRGDYVDGNHAEAECKKYDKNMGLAKIDNFLTFSMVGRELEEVVREYNLRDTWYWIQGQYDHSKEGYVIKTENGQVEQINFSAFLHRAPRPCGIGTHIDPDGNYKPNQDVPQCLALALPWPGIQQQENEFFGHGTVIDERPCESKQQRHVLCENPNCKTENNDLYVITDDESKRPYFENGNWIFGDRKFIVNWKYRTQQESKEYCKSLNLKLYEPGSDEIHLIPLLKMWSRSVTVSQFWTAFSYDELSKKYLDTNGKPVDLKQVTFVEPEGLGARSSRGDIFCVGMAHSYEMKDQSPCDSMKNQTCNWSFIKFFPISCKGHLATICQHHDSETRKIEFKPEYILDVDKALRETALVPYRFKENTQLLRSTYKQAFGSLYCPPGYRMHVQNSFGHLLQRIPPWIKHNDIYDYDKLEEYWIVTGDKFNKTESSLCSYVTPGNNNEVKTAPCNQWRFYLCEALNIYEKQPNINSPPPPKSKWTTGPQRRVFPIYTEGNPAVNSYTSRCIIGSKQRRAQTLILIDRHEDMKRVYSKLPDMLWNLDYNMKKFATHNEFALSFYNRWEYSKADQEYTKRCYLSEKPFTSDMNSIIDGLKTVKFTTSPTYYFNIHSALAFASTDKNVGWLDDDIDSKDRHVYRLALLFTRQGRNASQSYLQNLEAYSQGRIPFIGDGTDSCERSKNVEMNVYQTLMQRTGVCPIGWFSESTQEISEYSNETRVVSYYNVFKQGAIEDNFVNQLRSGLSWCGQCFHAHPPGYNTLGL